MWKFNQQKKYQILYFLEKVTVFRENVVASVNLKYVYTCIYSI